MASPDEKTTEDLVAEYPQGREAELLPAEYDLEEIEPYKDATPVLIRDWVPDGAEPREAE